MPPKIKTDDIIEALLDPKVQEALSANMSSSLALMIDEILSKKLDSVLRTCSDLKKENVSLRQNIDKLEKSYTVLSRTNDDLVVRMNAQEAYTRRENIVIRGVPEQSYSEAGIRSGEGQIQDTLPTGSSMAVEQSVIALCRDKLGIDILPNEISSAHRIKKRDKDATRPIIVRFATSKIRDRIMRAKKLLRTDSSRIYISEHLTNSTSKLFYEARKLVAEKKIASTWTMNGVVYFKRSTSADEKPSVMPLNLAI